MRERHGALIAARLSRHVHHIDPAEQTEKPQQGIAYFCHRTKYRGIMYDSAAARRQP